MTSPYAKLSPSRNCSISSGITFLLLQEAKTVFLSLGDGEYKQLAGIPTKTEGGSVGFSLPRYEINDLQLEGQW